MTRAERNDADAGPPRSDPTRAASLACRLGPIAVADLLGVMAARKRLPAGARRLHHIAYATCLVSATWQVARARASAPAALVQLGLLAILPATHGGSRVHRGVAAATTLCTVVAARVERRRLAMDRRGIPTQRNHRSRSSR